MRTHGRIYGRTTNNLKNPLSPHDALKHHFTSLKTDLIFLQLGVLEQNVHETGFQYMAIFFTFPTNHFHPLQVENCGRNSRLVVDEDDNGKFRPERVEPNNQSIKQYDFYSAYILSGTTSESHKSLAWTCVIIEAKGGPSTGIRATEELWLESHIK